MEISIIIPVYNAATYVAKAVSTALAQPETAEVLLIEDGSTDDSLKICADLESKYEKVRLITHADGMNHGAGISRNLGVETARCDYIAFLDADDFFLPNRFAKAREVFLKDPIIDGVYEAVGCEFENEEARRRYFDTHKDEIASIKVQVEPEKLFFYMISGKYGYIHLDGFVAKKEAIIKVGMFPNLRLHQDMIFFFKVAALCRLAPGQIGKPVALRRLHFQNRITNPNTDFQNTVFMAYDYLVNWIEKNSIDVVQADMAKTRYFMQKYRLKKRQHKYIMAIYYYIYYQIFFKKNESRLKNPEHWCKENVV